jgi:hypothetical protein
MMISCHDEGFFMQEGQYYVLKGSRFRFGYSSVLSPYLPIFFSGEEFDAHQVSLPNLKSGLFGGGGPGGWLYGSWIQWNQLDEPRHRDMLADCKKMLKIRKENKDIIHSCREDTNIVSVPAKASRIGIPKPYARFLPGEKAIVIVGNDNERHDVDFNLSLPLEAMSMQGRGRYKITDLWNNTVQEMNEFQLSSLKVTVPRDKKVGGGVRVLKIEAL